MNEREMISAFESLQVKRNKLIEEFWQQSKLRSVAHSLQSEEDKQNKISEVNELRRESIDSFNKFKSDFDSLIDNLFSSGNVIDMTSDQIEGFYKIQIGQTIFYYIKNIQIYKENTEEYIRKDTMGYYLED